MKNSIVSILCLLTLLIGICSCASTPKIKKSVIEEREERMFWEINSPTGTKIYVLGSVHVGNEETAKIDPLVMEAFLTADCRYGELSLTDILSMEQYIMQVVADTLVLDEEGKNVPVYYFLTEEETAFLINLCKIFLDEEYSEEVFITLSLLPPWYWNNMLDSIATEIAGYNSSLGVDMVLYSKAMENNLEVLGLDTVESQIDVLTFGSLEDQIALLKLNIENLQQDDWDKNINDTLNYYLTNDKEGLTKVLTASDEITDLDQEYNDQFLVTLIDERNRLWADKFASMLQEENKTYFVFAGAAHWLYSPTVFELLEQDGLLKWK